MFKTKGVLEVQNNTAPICYQKETPSPLDSHQTFYGWKFYIQNEQEEQIWADLANTKMQKFSKSVASLFLCLNSKYWILKTQNYIFMASNFFL